MAKIISFFNHKGGVGKTTTVFNIGWKLADIGLKVLIVDADPQCNLTALTLGLDEEIDLFSWYNSKDNENIFEKLSPVIEGTGTTRAVNPAFTKHKNLFLVAGSIKMSEIDIYISIALTQGRYLKITEGYIGAFNACIRETDRIEKFDIILVDMSPNASAFNRTILMGSDYFVIPTSPDFFSYQAIQSLANLLPDWEKQFQPFRDSKVKDCLPEFPPKLLGIISQKYRMYNVGADNINDKNQPKQKNIAKSYRDWMDKIQNYTSTSLADKLMEHKMIIEKSLFISSMADANLSENTPYNLMNISDFNSLIAIAQKHNKPVYALTKDELEKDGKVGAVQNTMIKSQEEFDKCFTCLARSICNMIGLKLK